MSAEERCSDSIYFSNCWAKDQRIHAISNPARTAYPSPSHNLRPQLNVGSASCGASPPTSQCRQGHLQNAVTVNVDPPWQARPKAPAAGISPIPIAHAADGGHEGQSAQSVNGTKDSFDAKTKRARNVVIIIDERALVRDCLVYCLQAKYDSPAVFSFATLSDWIKVEDDFPVPSVILLGSQTGQKKALNDSDDVESLAHVAMNAPLIIVSDVEDGSRIKRAIESGARGYIPTSMTLGVAVEAVRLVEAGGTFVPISAMSSFRSAGQDESQLFTARQIMVIEALRRGRANKQIAYELGMCESTVKVHIRHIMRKLKARNRTEVAMMASGLFDKLEQDRPD
ncbi:response regulator transcription factor [Nitrobacter sp. Nb-311A]|uniref:response regulator transcription factor n=1 Tax=Nitrobacter sp. Nb-311A TaxID=314253 RepID=UPI00032661E4|nr:response regulator transcription factor [Nitrobacter sp. Nb-311A]